MNQTKLYYLTKILKNIPIYICYICIFTSVQLKAFFEMYPSNGYHQSDLRNIRHMLSVQERIQGAIWPNVPYYKKIGHISIVLVKRYSNCTTY